MRLEIGLAPWSHPVLKDMYVADLLADDDVKLEWGIGVTIRAAIDNLRSCVEDDEMDNLAWVEEAKAFLDGAAHG